MEAGDRKSEIENPGGLLAGFGRTDITPRNPCFLVGYPHVERTSTGTHDPLFASAVCLENGGTPLLLISLDLLFITAASTRECRRRIGEVTRIPAQNILIGATHTHSGPHTAEVLAWKDDPVVPPVDREYLEFSVAGTVEAAVNAWRNREAAEAVWSTSDVRHLAGGNRIDSNGPEDPEAGLLLVRRLSDKSPLAVLSIYGMHPTVLHEDSTLISSDFIAFARREIETALPGAGGVYLNGVCGDQSPRRAVKAQTFAEAERLGAALGARMAETLKNATGFTSDLSLAAKSAIIELEGKTFPPVAEAEASLTAARLRYEQLKAAGAGHANIRTAECTVFGAEEVLTLAKSELTGEAAAVRRKYREAEIQVLRVGNSFVAGWPGEFFVDYGLETKRRAGRPVFISTLSNGELHGYVVTPEAEAARGYEAQMSLFPAAAGSLFVEKTLKLIGELT
jgi:neutral ceramidase